MRNIRLIRSACLWLVVVSFSLAGPVAFAAGDPAIAKQAWPMIESGALLLDVRSAEEYGEGHIEGALNIEWNRTDALLEAIGSDKARPVVLYCRSGGRAGKAIEELTARGYTKLFNATGFEALQETQP